jgi:hypothetical protein
VTPDWDAVALDPADDVAVALRDLAAGDHVHVHNLKSLRGRRAP